MSEASESPAKSPVLVGWVKLFHPSGVLCSLPIDGDTSSGFDYQKAFRSVQAAVHAGFTPNAPGLEAGEKREEVGYVLRREKENSDKTVTPMIDLYSPHDAVKFKILTVYLNNDEDVTAFEEASGLRLADLDAFPGTAAPQRGAGKQSDKYIRKVKAFHVVLTDNPKYDEKEAEAAVARKETYKVPKRVFVRWEGAEVATPDPMSREANGASEKAKDVTPGTLKLDEGMMGNWARFLATEPTIEELNRKVSYQEQIKTEATRRKIWEAIMEYAGDAERAWEWDKKNKKFVAPVEADDEGVKVGEPIPF